MSECPQHGRLNDELIASRYRFVRCVHIGPYYVDQCDDENGVVWIDYQCSDGPNGFDLIESWYRADIDCEGLTAEIVWDRLVDRMRHEAR